MSERSVGPPKAAAPNDTLGVLKTGKPARKGATVTSEDDLYRSKSAVLADRDTPTHMLAATTARGDA